MQTFIQGGSYESFLENRMVQNAVMRPFEVVGEAGRRISIQLREVIWRTATEDTPVLLQEIEKLIKEA